MTSSIRASRILKADLPEKDGQRRAIEKTKATILPLAFPLFGVFYTILDSFHNRETALRK